jgi:hypothetical protein
MAGNTGTVMSHMALHYRDGDYERARLLLEDLGCTLLDNGPPAAKGFCTALLDDARADCADNLLFLSEIDGAQRELERALLDLLGDGTEAPHPALTSFLDRRHAQAEAIAHLGIRYGTFEQLESVLTRLERDTQPGEPLAGRVEIFKRIPAPGHSRSVDDRIAASPVFTGDEPAGPAKHWVQCRIVTDVLGFGIVSLGSEFELDFVFDDWFAAPASFTPAADPRRG